MTRLLDVEAQEPGPPRRTVAIIPASARDRYPELLRALEEAHPVRFVGSTPRDVDSADAVIVFPGEQVPDALRVPRLILEQPGDERGLPFTVELSRYPGLDRALHGQRLVEAHAAQPAPVALDPGWRALARADGKPIWARTEADGIDCEIASALPLELQDHEFLRDHLSAGRFWSLLPIVHFLKKITDEVPKPSHVHRACFVIDDPNIRFRSYGHVSFRALAADARQCGYHVAVATIPLDLLVPGHRAASVFRAFGAELSLVVHGNDHRRRELERCRSTAAAERMITSAAARVARFERRAGLRIDRVMCPPHGRCGPEVLTALFTCGFLGLAANRPFPWDGFADQRRWRLGGWLPAQLVAGGLPVIPRYPLSGNLDDLVFRAFLGQPLILYCHHSDLRNGLEPFREAAARISELGNVNWVSLASITRENAVYAEHDGFATLTLYSREVRLARPPAPRVRVEIPRVLRASRDLTLVVDGVAHVVETGSDGRASVVLENDPAGRELRIRIAAPGNVAAATPRDWRPRAWPLVRRALTETRDRTVPLTRGLRS
jgi:hypothetical protein